jgi:hypothetical protein
MLFRECSLIIRGVVLVSAVSPPSAGWIALTVCTYGLLYAFILYAAWREMAVLQSQVRKLSAQVLAAAVRPLRQKHHAFRIFLVLVLADLGLEVVCRYLLATHAASFVTTIALYECVTAALLVGVAVCFAPRAYSVFHYMVPTSLEYELPGGEGATPAAGAGDRRAERVRIELSGRSRFRESAEDVAHLERLRRARTLR